MKNKDYVLTKDTKISCSQSLSVPVQKALEIFTRDFVKVLGVQPTLCDPVSAQLILMLDDTGLSEPESFALRFEEKEGETILTVAGKDDLGLIYGLLHLSELALGVDPFWFWTDREPVSREKVTIVAQDYLSPTAQVRYRGWFVNDEVCLIGWTEDYPPPREVWEPVFETLLRLGGNLVIPGTDLPRKGIHAQVASEMGLYVSHHHAEPLGSEMFFRAYPESEASFDRNGALFETLWAEAIEAQKDRQIVWTLGFRGQGDCPFWEQDPAYDTDEKRGELIGRAIGRQYEMLQQAVPGAPCVTYIYGEIAELYRQGLVHFPDGVTKIWSDNGYGRMVSRRQHNHNPRIPSLPRLQDSGPHGIYYHATFHDLQASSHLLMLPVPTDLVTGELTSAFEAGADHLLLVNCGNIRPHIYTLGVIAKLWKEGQADPAMASLNFAQTYFASAPEAVANALDDVIAAAIAYGPHRDDRAGDEFYHHPARSLIGHVMRAEVERCAEDLVWATGSVPFAQQVNWFELHCAAAATRYVALEKECETLATRLTGKEAQLFEDFLLFQIRLHRSGAEGLPRFVAASPLFWRVPILRLLWKHQRPIGPFSKALRQWKLPSMENGSIFSVPTG